MPDIGFVFTDAALDFLDTLPPKIRKQVIKKANALHANPHPQGSKKLHDVVTDDGDSVYRERSGDYRILYVVRSSPGEVLILDIDHRKNVYRMPKTRTEPADGIRIKEAGSDFVMGQGLTVAAVQDDAGKAGTWLSSYPPKKRGESSM